PVPPRADPAPVLQEAAAALESPPEAPVPETTEEAFERSEMPLPTDPKTIFLGGLFGLSFLAACWAAQAVIIPVVMAFFFKVLLQPLIRLLGRWRVPRPLGALIALLLLATALLGLGVALSVPAASWGKTIS